MSTVADDVVVAVGCPMPGCSNPTSSPVEPCRSCQVFWGRYLQWGGHQPVAEVAPPPQPPDPVQLVRAGPRVPKERRVCAICEQPRLCVEVSHNWWECRECRRAGEG